MFNVIITKVSRILGLYYLPPEFGYIFRGHIYLSFHFLKQIQLFTLLAGD